MREPPHPAPEAISLEDVLFALSDPTRLRIAEKLTEVRELNASDFYGALSRSTMSHHFKILRESGITLTRREGTRCWVSLRREDLEQRFPGLLDMVLGHARVAKAVGS